MARQEAFITRGRLGNLIFYQRKGNGYVRQAPRRVKQTMATRQSAKDFGHAVQLSKYLRFLLRPALTNWKSREIMYKMNAGLLSWLRQQTPIEDNISFIGLEFNEKSAFKSKFRKELLIDFSVEGKVIITIPALKIPNDIVAPFNTSLIRLDFAVGGSRLQFSQNTAFAAAAIEIPYKDGWTDTITKELDFHCQPDTINVVAVSLHYTTGNGGWAKENVDERWTPATIVAAVVA
jgi:hypothetical protein